MRRSRFMLPSLAALALTTLTALTAATAGAQAAPSGFRDEFLGQFDMSMRKFIALAEAMPAEKYGWSPGPGVMTVAHVYAHVAHYNYGYPSGNMGVAVPAGMALDTLERMTDKAQVVALLRQSQAYVQQAVRAMPEGRLAQPTKLYGRDVAQWAVLLQLLAHMNEHLGQSIAYARSNGVVPPWSQ